MGMRRERACCHTPCNLCDEDDVVLIKGDKGDKGDQGEKGEQGCKGPAGDRGPQGEPGPQGDKGDQGPQGLKGEKGDQGPAGVDGPSGPEGPRGDTKIKCCKTIIKDGQEYLFLALECDDCEIKHILLPSCPDPDLTIVMCEDDEK